MEIYLKLSIIALFISVICQLFNDFFQKITYGLEFIVFLIALPIYYPLVIDNIHLGWITAGILIGCLAFIVSAVITEKSFKSINKNLMLFKDLPAFYLQHWWLPFMLLVIALYEEFLWRGILQTILGPVYLGIPIVALLFTIRHKPSLNGNCARIIDFLLFSLLLGISFWLWHSYIFIAMVHLFRNLGVFYYLHDDKEGLK